MASEAIVGILASILGGSMVAVTTAVLARKKLAAETEVLRAQAERERAEATRILTGLGLRAGAAEGAKTKRPEPKGWFLSGADSRGYEIGLDPDVRLTGRNSGYIRALPEAWDYGTIMQSCDATSFRGKRIRVCATVKTLGIPNGRAAQLWTRADDSNGTTVAFDNMANRPITGSRDWNTYCIVLDIPEEAETMHYGLLLMRGGKVWIDSWRFEEVSHDVPVTSKPMSAVTEPQNLDFEEGYDD